MTTIDEVRRLKIEGKTDEQVAQELTKLGVPEREVYDAISRSQIKDAVSSKDNNFKGNQGELPYLPPGVEEQEGLPQMPSSNPGFAPPVPNPGESTEYSAQYSGMQPSMLNQNGNQEYQTQQYSESGGQDQSYGGEYNVGGESYPADYSVGYPQYQPYQEAMSSDVITEISEQVVSERLAALQDRLERVLDMRTVLEARISNINERLKRIEKVIDTLQLSLLQKVGEYVNDVRDIRTEMQETQKSFSALTNKSPHSSHTHTQHKPKHRKK